MSDGVKLRGDLTLPAGADGKAISTKVPVVVTITAYNKTVIAGGFGGTLAGADPAYLVKRGYAQLTVDARGTGSSEGQWNAFDKRENKDAAEVMTWAHAATVEQRPDRDDRRLLHGDQPDLRRRRQACRPEGDLPAGPRSRRLPRRRRLGRPGRRGLHPAVARAGHRDRSDPAGRGRPSDPQSAIGAMASRIGTAGTFTGPTLVKAMAGGDTAYDGPFYAERSPINVIEQGGRADVPGRRGVRPLPARHPAALREPPQARCPDQDDHRSVGPPEGLVGSRGRQRRLRPAQRAAAALVRPLRHGQVRPGAGHRHRADDLVRAGHRHLAQGRQLGRQRPGRLLLATLRQRLATAPPEPSPGAPPRTARRTSCPCRSPVCAPGRRTSGPPGSWRRARPPTRAWRTTGSTTPSASPSTRPR